MSYLVSDFRSTHNHIPLKYECPYYFFVGLSHAYLIRALENHISKLVGEGSLEKSIDP